MTPQETALVTTLLERLKTIDSADKDRAAEILIRQAMTEQPDAAYHLVQTVLIQDLSLHVAQNRIAKLEKSLAEPRIAHFLPNSFLGGLLTRTNRLPRPLHSPAKTSCRARQWQRSSVT